MITKYRIEYWNPVTNQYETGWTGNNFELADRIMFKSYNRLHTRRLIKQTEEVLYTEKGNARNKIHPKTD